MLFAGARALGTGYRGKTSMRRVVRGCAGACPAVFGVSGVGVSPGKAWRGADWSRQGGSVIGTTSV